jgi:hypothetical protein
MDCRAGIAGGGQSNESAFQRSVVSASKRRHSRQTLLVTMPTWPNQTKLQLSRNPAWVTVNLSHAVGEGDTRCLSVFLPIGPSGGGYGMHGVGL